MGMDSEVTRDLLIIGGTIPGLSLASRAKRAGVRDVLVVRYKDEEFEDLVHIDHLNAASVDGIERIAFINGTFEVVTGSGQFSARTVVIDAARADPSAPWPWPVPADIDHRLHRSVDFPSEDEDVLVVGHGDTAVATAAQLVRARARVVLSLDEGAGGVSLLGRQVLERLEREQLATILWRSPPEAIWSVGGFPMATFGDRRTPDLQFDHVVVSIPEASPEIPFPVEFPSDAGDGLFVITGSGRHTGPGMSLSPTRSWEEIQPIRYPENALVAAASVAEVDDTRARELAATHYNATITSFDTAHNELWRIRLRPDREAIAHSAGQYCSIGLGFWEPRADASTDPNLESRLEKVIRRSYSISSPIFDERGYLAGDGDEIELYIVWVQPDADRIPALTPRLALKNVGDRLYLGPKVAGRYTVDPITDPSASVVFIGTGTGEAPHNAMLVDLLRRGHYGKILSVVTVRYLSDLAYLSEHRELEERYPNYRYLPVPTREPGLPKLYAQDLLRDGAMEDALRAPLDPVNSHVFLCGNPSMIGLPEYVEEVPVYPETPGMAELLSKQGFILDHRKVSGNVHYEEYW